MTLGYTESALVVSFGKCIDFDILMSNCKRQFLMAQYTKQYLRFENVNEAFAIRDWEINTEYWSYAQFVKIYSNVVKQHIYTRTRVH